MSGVPLLSSSLTCLALVFYHFRPPMRTCIDPNCTRPVFTQSHVTQAYELTEPQLHTGTVFTNDFGPLPCRTTSLYCRSECLLRVSLENVYGLSDNQDRLPYTLLLQLLRTRQCKETYILRRTYPTIYTVLEAFLHLVRALREYYDQV